MIDQNPAWLKNSGLAENIVGLAGNVNELCALPLAETLQEPYQQMLANIKNNKRRAEFLAGRVGFHLLAQALDIELKQVSADPKGLPLLPKTIVGSLSHSDGELVAVMAKKDEISALGLDRERIVSSDQARGLSKKVAAVEEWDLFEEGLPLEQRFTLLFAAKEALFKAVYALIKTMFWFEDARLVGVDLEKRKLSFELHRRLLSEQMHMSSVDVFWQQEPKAFICLCRLRV